MERPCSVLQKPVKVKLDHSTACRIENEMTGYNVNFRTVCIHAHALGGSVEGGNPLPLCVGRTSLIARLAKMSGLSLLSRTQVHRGFCCEKK